MAESNNGPVTRSAISARSAIGSDIDFNFLSIQFKLTGGNIKNIESSAAFLTAEEARSMKMSDLILGTKSKLRKQGKLCTKGGFGPYYELIQKTG